jgi:hypothetical protein
MVKWPKKTEDEITSERNAYAARQATATLDGKRALADIMAARMDGEFKASALAYIELMAAGYDELVKLAALVGEENDPFAAWESIQPALETLESISRDMAAGLDP